MQPLKPIPPRMGLLALAFALSGMGGCKDREIRSYRTAKEAEDGGRPAASSRAPAQPPSMPAADNTNDLPRETLSGSPALTIASARPAAGSSLLWETPATWTSLPSSAMRRGSYSLGPGGAVELAITAFPGDVGGTLANVNRWLGQVGLPPVDGTHLGDVASSLEANGLNFVVVDTGAKDASSPQRIVAAMAAWEGNTWFFKLTGPGERVAREKPGFIEFLKTVRSP